MTGPIMTDDVIAAAATPPGVGAIGVVRLSGPGAGEVLARVFTVGPDVLNINKRSRSAASFISHKMYHGFIHANGRLADEVMCCFFRAPRSYTREDAAEIYTHGGMVAVRGVLAAVLQNGARPAQPGEFTRRAFINGRLDLAQAEAVAATIVAKTDMAAQAGLRQLGGGLSHKIEGFRNTILRWLAHIELSIDYPEHESEAMNLAAVRQGAAGLLAEIKALKDTYRTGRVITQGVRAVIAGRPNVGKSSLLNAVLREDRAIVTEIPGTTRDVLTEPVNVRGVPLLLADTAGLRDTSDEIEKRGVDKSYACARDADMVWWMLDRSQPPAAEDAELEKRLGITVGGYKKIIVILNKCDLPEAEGWDTQKAALKAGGFSAVVEISAQSGGGLPQLYSAVEDLYLSGLDTPAAETDIITQDRHFYLLEEAERHITAAAAAIDAGFTEDIAAVDLTAACQALGGILGLEVDEEIINRIFSEFCVGK